MLNAPFFVTHNSKETRFWRVKKDKSPGYRESINDIPKADDTEKEIKKLGREFNQLARHVRLKKFNATPMRQNRAA